jgi:hypothetical protein
MQVSFQSPVAGLIGKLEYSGKFYIRKIHRKYILQHCPNRQNHIPTPHEKANQQRFIQQYRRLLQEVKGERLEIIGGEILGGNNSGCAKLLTHPLNLIMVIGFIP